MGYATNPLDGVRLAYEVVGDGEPLLLVHGSGLSKAIWRGYGYQRELRQDYCVITVDMRGHGRSDKPHQPESYAMDVIVRDVLAVLDACSLPSTHYLGYSFGARTGFALAAAHPQRVRTLTTIGGTFGPLTGHVDDLFFPGYLEALENGGMERFLDSWARHRGSALDPATKQAFRANDAAAFTAYLRQSATEAGIPVEALSRISTPALLFAGTADPHRLNDSKTAAEQMPHASFRELAGRDHATSLEPMAEITGILREFLQR